MAPPGSWFPIALLLLFLGSSDSASSFLFLLLLLPLQGRVMQPIKLRDPTSQQPGGTWVPHIGQKCLVYSVEAPITQPWGREHKVQQGDQHSMAQHTAPTACSPKDYSSHSMWRVGVGRAKTPLH